MFSKELSAKKITEIPGIIELNLAVFGDNRGWFKENWQREKMTKLGLPDFKPIQNNISFNESRGTTRGIHAEPWDKFISVGSGSVFGAWVDLRAGETFGNVYTTTLDPSKAIFIPRGVANAFQTLEDNTVYTYLVNDHWYADAEYKFVNLADESLSINWPIALDNAVLSDKDKLHPNLKDIEPIEPKKVMITGANGQLGRALQNLYPNAVCLDRNSFDLTDRSAFDNYSWRQYDLILNAAAYTAVDLAETTDGRKDAWQSNVTAVRNLSEVAIQNNITLVHISSDYVFDGEKEIHTEDETFAPLGVYGQTKAAGDIVVSLAPKHYIVRTSWVIGDGKNFVGTMKSLAEKSIKPSVVDDQIGRLTFTSDLADGIKHLVDSGAEFGTYNLTGDGPSVSWCQVAKLVYEKSGFDQNDVSGVSTSEYYKNSTNLVSPRPKFSTLDLTKIKATGFQPKNWQTSLSEYLNKEEKL